MDSASNPPTVGRSGEPVSPDVDSESQFGIALVSILCFFIDAIDITVFVHTL